MILVFQFEIVFHFSSDGHIPGQTSGNDDRKRLYAKMRGLPSGSYESRPFWYQKIWVIASAIGSGISGYMHSTTASGMPFTKRMISGIMCLSVPGMEILNRRMVKK